MRQLPFGLDSSITLCPGDQGPEVLAMQQALFTRGYPAPQTGVFDGATANALKSFQQAAGLTRSGCYDPGTQGKLMNYAPVAEVAPFTGQMPARKIAGAAAASEISPMMIVGGLGLLGLAFYAYRKWQAGKKEPGPGAAIQMAGHSRKRKHWWGSGSAFEPFRADDDAYTPPKPLPAPQERLLHRKEGKEIVPVMQRRTDPQYDPRSEWERRSEEYQKIVQSIPGERIRTYVDPVTGQVKESSGRITRAKDPTMNYPRSGGRKRRESKTGAQPGFVRSAPTRFRPEEVGEKADLWLRREDTKDTPPGTYPIRIEVDQYLWREPHYREEQIRRARAQAKNEGRRIQIVDRKTKRVLKNFRDIEERVVSKIDRAAALASAGKCDEAVQALVEARRTAHTPEEIAFYNKITKETTKRCPKSVEAAVAFTREVEADVEEARLRHKIAHSASVEPETKAGSTAMPAWAKPLAREQIEKMTPEERERARERFALRTKRWRDEQIATARLTVVPKEAGTFRTQISPAEQQEIARVASEVEKLEIETEGPGAGRKRIRTQVYVLPKKGKPFTVERQPGKKKRLLIPGLPEGGIPTPRKPAPGEVGPRYAPGRAPESQRYFRPGLSPRERGEKKLTRPIPEFMRRK